MVVVLYALLEKAGNISLSSIQKSTIRYISHALNLKKNAIHDQSLFTELYIDTMLKADLLLSCS